MSSADPTKTHVAREHQHNSPLIACRFDPGGQHVFFAAEDSQVWRWQWSGDAKVQLAGHDSWVRALDFHPDGQTLVTGGYDGRLMWWPALDEKPLPARQVAAHDGWVRALAVSPDGSLIATAGNDNLVKLWNFADGGLVREMAGHSRYVYNVAFHPDGKDLVSGDLMGQLRHWEVATGKELRSFQVAALHKYDDTFKADIGGFRDLAFSADGQLLAGSGITNVTNAFAGVGNPLVVVLNWQSGKETTQHISKGKLRGVAWGVAWHPDNFLIGISGGGGGGYLLFWKPDEPEPFHQLKLPNTARGLHLCPDGLHLATAHHDRKLRISKMAEKA